MTGIDNTETPVQPTQPTSEPQQVSQPSQDTPADTNLDSSVVSAGEGAVPDAPQSAAQTTTSPPSDTSTPQTSDEINTSVAPEPPLPDIAMQQRVDNPALSSLKAIFPDFDDAVLLSILESVDGDQDRALDIILGMSDPDYVSQPVAEVTPPPPSQTELDEQFARQLLLEDQFAQQALGPPGPEPQPIPLHQQVPYGTYDPRQRHGHMAQPQGPQQPPPQGAERDTMTELQDQFNKFAETGKRTIGNLFAKVKAKVSEFDQPRTSGQPSTWTAVQVGGPPPGLQQDYPSYFDPNVPAPGGRIQGGQQQPPILTSDIPPRTPARRATVPSNLPSPSSETPQQPLIAPEAALQATSTQTAAVAPAANIDPTKLGLLPKRPVSLLQPVPPPVRKDSEDDDLEYVENPFEDEQRK